MPYARPHDYIQANETHLHRGRLLGGSSRNLKQAVMLTEIQNLRLRHSDFLKSREKLGGVDRKWTIKPFEGPNPACWWLRCERSITNPSQLTNLRRKYILHILKLRRATNLQSSTETIAQAIWLSVKHWRLLKIHLFLIYPDSQRIFVCHQQVATVFL